MGALTNIITPVILSGGSGTRLWPLSRPHEPKQLRAMVGDRTMLRATIDRLAGVPDVAEPWVVCNVAHRHLVAAELRAAGLDPAKMILEPFGRNTAPAAAAAARVLGRFEPDARMLLLPADHVIRDVATFHEAIATAGEAARRDRLATFGIVPSHPETGYGYIEVGGDAGPGWRAVAAFVEKPDRATAEGYVASGRYLWNSGMFLFPAAAYLEELRRHAPAIAGAVDAAVAAADREMPVVLPEEEFTRCPADSIDYAVMEHTEAAVVVPLDAGWSDVGSWSALWELQADDAAANVLVGDVVCEDVSGSYLRSESRLVTAVGLREVVVVETPDAVMVTTRAGSQDVKRLVDELKERGRMEAVASNRTHEPWGLNELLGSGTGYEVRRMVLPGGSQETILLPPRRADRTLTVAAGHGIVEVDGTAVDIDQQGIAVPATAVVSVQVASTEPLELIEVARTAEEDE